MSQTLFIDGKWVGAKKGETRQIINPYNQEHIETVSEGDREDAVRAIAAERAAHLTTASGRIRRVLNEATSY